MQAIKNAMLIKEKYPAIAVTIFYMDVRAYGKGYEEYYERAKNVGVRFMRGIPSDVQADKNGTGMQFRVENTETGEVEVLRPGLVVLSVGIQPTDATAALAGKLGLPIEEDRIHPVGARCIGHNRNDSGRGSLLPVPRSRPETSPTALPREEQPRCGHSRGQRIKREPRARSR